MEASQHTFVAETGQPTQRRKKARLACNPCRARKTGCDGRKPVCSACSMRGWDDKCFYPDSVMQPSTALTLVDIDRRLQKLENARAGQDASRSSPSSAQHPSSSLDVAAAHDAGRAGSSSAEPSLASAGTSFGHAAMDERPSDEPVAARPNEPSAASNMAFNMRQGMEVPGRQGRPHDLTMNSESPVSPTESPTFPDLVGFSLHTPDRPPDEFNPQNLYLPPRAFADELLRWYWQNFHSIFPLLHWPMFKSKYRALWKQKPPPRPAFDDILFYATANMVMALACLRLDRIPLEQRQSQAEDFYHRSLRLVSVEALDTASIPIVQLLLLRAMYLYFAGKADRCWLMSGAAVRVAIGLGLHLDPRRHLNQLEREMRRRIWFGGCVSLDQYGNPSRRAILVTMKTGSSRLALADPVW
ncbi:fungal-specific transcription factor domain-containing protein [Thermothelomyces heterothallicus CBS 202.75]|uniref:fungal-specific transcription factor domain-containing protein n=1 Tax=Thermothelomyces heterothallicus CBS 202.75 TaxID=1149848 RepID=UPI0037446F38